MLRALQLLVGPTGGWRLEHANDINEVGQIVGYGTSFGGTTHAFLLSMVAQNKVAKRQ